MIGILFATEREAAPFLELVGGEKREEAPFCTYAFRVPGARPAVSGIVVVTGIGPTEAGAATVHLLAVHSVRMVVNAGICGSLNDARGVGDVVRIAEARLCTDIDTANEHRAHMLGAAPASLWPELPTARLVSTSEPVFDSGLRTRFAELGDCVDQEGAVVAATCEAQGVPCHLLKGVSDLAGPGGRDTLLQNLDSVSVRIAALLLEGISAWCEARPGPFGRVARFVKIEHTVLSLPLVFAGAWLGQGGRAPSLRSLLLVALAGAAARSLGMAVNRIADRRLDLLNPRTAVRELPRGHISLTQACAVAGGGAAVYLLACALLGRICLVLAPVPLVALLGYSYLKRFTSLCHFGIGLCLAMGPLGAYVATSGGIQFSPAVLLLALFTFCWVSAFDIIYALQDVTSDLQTGVHSLPARFGPVRAQAIGALVHTVSLGGIAGVAVVTGGGVLAWLSVAVAGAGLALAYAPFVPLPARFFPLSAVVGIAGALVPFFGGRP